VADAIDWEQHRVGASEQAAQAGDAVVDAAVMVDEAAVSSFDQTAVMGDVLGPSAHQQDGASLKVGGFDRWGVVAPWLVAARQGGVFCLEMIVPGGETLYSASQFAQFRQGLPRRVLVGAVARGGDFQLPPQVVGLGGVALILWAVQAATQLVDLAFLARQLFSDLGHLAGGLGLGLGVFPLQRQKAAPIGPAGCLNLVELHVDVAGNFQTTLVGGGGMGHQCPIGGGQFAVGRQRLPLRQQLARIVDRRDLGDDAGILAVKSLGQGLAEIAVAAGEAQYRDMQIEVAGAPRFGLDAVVLGRNCPQFNGPQA